MGERKRGHEVGGDKAEGREGQKEKNEKVREVGGRRAEGRRDKRERKKGDN